MTYEREDYMRRQDAEHDMIRMREPRSVRQFSAHPDPRDEIIADLVAALDGVVRKYGMFGDGWFVLSADHPVQIGRDLLDNLAKALGK